MYLIQTDTFERARVDGATPSYAILSHRWQKEEEDLYRDFNPMALRDTAFEGRNDNQKALLIKIRGACRVARSEGLKYIWIDSCCIDKSSSEELRRALNSMFAWYAEAKLCLTYLYDVSFRGLGKEMFNRGKISGPSQTKFSEWYERGWTLQELLAPRSMKFYDKDWRFMGTRDDLSTLIGSITGIKAEYLQDAEVRYQKFREASIATKMSWMAGRFTRDIEDIAYSMLGVLNVNMVPQYGEGIRAFSRLQETLMADSNAFDESLFAWKLPSRGLRCYRRYFENNGRFEESIPPFSHLRWGLLAPSPDCFAETKDVTVDRLRTVSRLGTGFQRTNQGVHLPLPLKETKNRLTGMDKKEISLPLNCWRNGNPVVLELSRDVNRVWQRSDCSKCEGKKGAKVGHNRVLGIDQGSALLGEVTTAQPQLQLDYPR